MAWWHHQMETFSALLAICAGNSPLTGEFPTQRPVTRSFDVFFDLRLNIRLSKQSWGWWFEMPSRPLWRHCNGYQPFYSCSPGLLQWHWAIIWCTSSSEVTLKNMDKYVIWICDKPRYKWENTRHNKAMWIFNGISYISNGAGSSVDNHQ